MGCPPCCWLPIWKIIKSPNLYFLLTYLLTLATFLEEKLYIILYSYRWNFGRHNFFKSIGDFYIFIFSYKMCVLVYSFSLHFCLQNKMNQTWEKYSCNMFRGQNSKKQTTLVFFHHLKKNRMSWLKKKWYSHH